jgi:hypothetical protein
MLLWGLCNPKGRFTFASLTNNLKTILMSSTEIRVQFANKNTNKRAFFIAYLKSANPYFAQTGDFRSDYSFKQFDCKVEFDKAICKYLNNINARVELLELDGSFVVGDSDFLESMLYDALGFIDGRKFIIENLMNEIQG